MRRQKCTERKKIIKIIHITSYLQLQKWRFCAICMQNITVIADVTINSFNPLQKNKMLIENEHKPAPASAK